jgi:general secretion pathway protein H
VSAAVLHQRCLHRRGHGFTLIELLVVVVIGGIALGAISLQAFGNNRRTLQDDAQRIALLLQLAREEAILRNRPIAFEANAGQYRFLVSEEQGWQVLSQDSLLRQRDFKLTPMRLSIPATARQDGNIRIIFGREPIDKPFVLTLATTDAVATIRADGVGHFSVD